MFTAEYRWYVQEFVDMAIFYDTGKVAAERSQLDFDGLKSSVGAGIRFHGPQTTAVRLELARSREGWRFIFGFSPVGGR
jgi:hemolysin activation/secretion protein